MVKPNLQGRAVTSDDPPRDRAGMRAAGGVLWRRAADGIEIGLVQRMAYGDWTFPRGRLRAGEPPLAGAVRRVVEETGQQVVVDRRLLARHDLGSGMPKMVDYWSMRVIAGAVATPEASELAWLTPGEARARLTHDDDVGLLATLGSAPVDSTVLLVRHGAAGDPDRWAGDDAQRPLDTTGLGHAEMVRRLLPLFGVTRVLSVPNVRCVDTVSPLAIDLGLAVEHDSALSEHAYAAHPDLGLRRLRELNAESVRTVVCSQGMVIPDVVTTIAAQDGVPLSTVKAKKGSVWALFFRKQRLLAADYYPSLG